VQSVLSRTSWSESVHTSRHPSRLNARDGTVALPQSYGEPGPCWRAAPMTMPADSVEAAIM
jgi:hypothetical protein